MQKHAKAFKLQLRLLCNSTSFDRILLPSIVLQLAKGSKLLLSLFVLYSKKLVTSPTSIPTVQFMLTLPELVPVWSDGPVC